MAMAMEMANGDGDGDGDGDDDGDGDGDGDGDESVRLHTAHVLCWRRVWTIHSKQWSPIRSRHFAALCRRHETDVG